MQSRGNLTVAEPLSEQLQDLVLADGDADGAQRLGEMLRAPAVLVDRGARAAQQCSAGARDRGYLAPVEVVFCRPQPFDRGAPAIGDSGFADEPESEVPCGSVGGGDAS